VPINLFNKDKDSSVNTVVGGVIDDTPAPSTSENKKILAYLRSLPSKNGLPLKSHFNPMRIAPYLPAVYMLDVLDGGKDFRVRLMGTDIVYHAGQDLTGRKTSELNNIEFRVNIYQDVVALRQPLSKLVYVGEMRGHHKVMDNLYVPLGDSDGILSFIMIACNEMPGKYQDYA
jgi:hypothetical protein